MSASALLEDLCRKDVRLEADGLMLRVDAPEEVVTDELREELRDNKRALIRTIEAERIRLEQASRRGLVIKWARESGYIAVHDPTTGEWHEVPSSGCPAWVVEEARAYHRNRKASA